MRKIEEIKKRRYIRKGIVLLSVIIATWSCTNRNRSEINTGSTEVESHFTDLFMADLGGFEGGDGTYSVLLPDGRTAWIFGDTFIDGVNSDMTRSLQDPMYIRNCVVIQDRDSLNTLFQKRNGKNASFAIPPVKGNIREDSVWFWPGDAFVHEDRLYIFYSEFTQQDTGMWGFHWENTWIGSYLLPDLEEEYIKKLDIPVQKEVHFGHAVHVDKRYTYVYGAGEKKQPYAARFSNGNIFSNWEYFTGSGWTKDPANIAPMSAFEGSEQFTVFKHHKSYILVTQLGGLGNDICSFISDTPYGPWKNKSLLYSPPLPDSTKNIFTYNAVAHPQFDENNRLLVSYNTNSFELSDHFKDARIYRPRFFRVPYELILNSQD